MKKEADHIFLYTRFSWSANSPVGPQYYAGRVDGMTKGVDFTSTTVYKYNQINVLCNDIPTTIPTNALFFSSERCGLVSLSTNSHSM